MNVEYSESIQQIKQISN